MDDEQSYEGAYEPRKSAHKSDAVYEVGPIRKRVWTLAEKLTILQEGMAPGAVPADVMRRYGISSSLYYTWRKQALSGAAAGLRQSADRGAICGCAAEPATACKPYRDGETVRNQGSY